MDDIQKDDVAEHVAFCPECDTAIPVGHEVALETILECKACGTESEVINLSPLTLAPLEEEK